MADMNYVVWLILEAKNNASAELNKLWDKIDNIKNSTVQLSDTTKKAMDNIWKVWLWIIWTLWAVWWVSIKLASDLEPVKNSFEDLTKSIWVDSEEMLSELKKASKWAVSNYDMMLAANKSMKLWVAKNTEDMTWLMKIARLYWQQMWQDVSKSFDDIVTWLWRWSPMILDNLWIVIDSETEYAKYAESIGKTAKELTKAEKTQALVNATLREWQKALDEFGEPAQTTAEMLQELKNNFQDIWVSIWEALLPIIQNLVSHLTPIIEKVSTFIKEHPDLVTQIMAIAWAIWWVMVWVWALWKVLSALPWIIATLTSPLWIIIAAITALWLARANNRFWIRDKTQEVIEFIKPYIQEFIATIKKFREEHWTQILTAIFAFRDLLKDLIKNAIDWIALTFEWLFTVLWVIMDIFQWDREWAWTKIKDFWKKIAETIDTIMTRTFGDMRTNIKNWVTEAYERILWKITALVEKIQKAVQKLKDAWNSAKERLWNVWENVWNFFRWKAVWWPVYSWNAYMVWENWPEMFIPSQNWRIVRNEDLAYAWAWEMNISINFWDVSINDWTDQQSLAETIASTITRQLELYKKWIY